MEENNKENQLLQETELNEDFSQFSKKDLINYLKEFKPSEQGGKGMQNLLAVKAAMDHLLETEKQEAFQKYIADGGEADGFEYRKDETIQQFDKTFTQRKNEMHELIQQQEVQKQKNLEAKKNLINQLRDLVANEVTSQSFNELKKIQEDWKKYSPVPLQYNAELWESYKALMDIFYNNRSIHFDLIELDRKKNLEAKQEIVQKAEKLIDMQHINSMLKELKNLHDEYKHIGPVPKDESENLWNRLKAATDKVYEKRKKFLEEQQQQFLNNEGVKHSLILEIKALAEFQSSRIDDWKEKTQLIVDLQQKWKKSGQVGIEKAKELSSEFWESCKQFYKNKSNFFKEIDKKREENLGRKLSIVEKIETMIQEADHTMKQNLFDLQKQFEKIGQVPMKQKDKIAERYKQAVDGFFNAIRSKQEEAEKEFYKNYEEKKKLVESIAAYIESASEKTLEKLKEFVGQWESIGYVPTSVKQEINDAYQKAIEKFIEVSSHIDVDRKPIVLLEMEVVLAKTSKEIAQKVKQKENALLKKIQTVKSDLTTYKTNIEFFGNSKNAGKMIEEIKEKINVLEKEMEKLNKELKIIRG